MATISTCHQKNLQKPKSISLPVLPPISNSSYPFPSGYIAGAAVLISPYIQRWKIRQPSIFIISGNKSVVLITIIRKASSSSYDNCVGIGIRNGTWIPKHCSGSQMIKIIVLSVPTIFHDARERSFQLIHQVWQSLTDLLVEKHLSWSPTHPSRWPPRQLPMNCAMLCPSSDGESGSILRRKSERSSWTLCSVLHRPSVHLEYDSLCEVSSLEVDMSFHHLACTLQRQSLIRIHRL